MSILNTRDVSKAPFFEMFNSYNMPTRFLTLDMNDSQVPSYGEDMSNYHLLLKGLFINLTSFVHMLNFVFIRGVVSFILVRGA